MFRAIIYIGILLGAISCGKKVPELRTGDLVFQVADSSSMSQAISQATDRGKSRNFSHVGIIVSKDGRDSVLEATSKGGVRMTSWTEFQEKSLKIGEHRGIVAMRLRDTSGVKASVERALKQLGKPYDYSFRRSNGRFYCSELVEEHYFRPTGAKIFKSQPMNFRDKDGNMPEFWTELFEKLGEEIPENEPGTNPNDLSKSEELMEIYSWY